MNLSGPIPGENFTSDTKNYPWHRPPEYTDLDKAIDACAKQLMAPKSARGLLTMIEMGLDIVTITGIFVMSGIGAGKWTPDFALLLVGPVSHIIVLMCEGRGIDYELGLNDDEIDQIPSSAYLKAVQTDKEFNDEKINGVDLSQIKSMAGEQEQPPSIGGFGAPQPQMNEGGVV